MINFHAKLEYVEFKICLNYHFHRDKFLVLFIEWQGSNTECDIYCQNNKSKMQRADFKFAQNTPFMISISTFESNLFI